MGCCGDREKAIAVSEEQKWDYIVCVVSEPSRVR